MYGTSGSDSYLPDRSLQKVFWILPCSCICTISFFVPPDFFEMIFCLNKKTLWKAGIEISLPFYCLFICPSFDINILDNSKKNKFRIYLCKYSSARFANSQHFYTCFLRPARFCKWMNFGIADSPSVFCVSGCNQSVCSRFCIYLVVLLKGCLSFNCLYYITWYILCQNHCIVTIAQKQTSVCIPRVMFCALCIGKCLFWVVYNVLYSNIA